MISSNFTENGAQSAKNAAECMGWNQKEGDCAGSTRRIPALSEMLQKNA